MEGFFEGSYKYKCEFGNSSPNELEFYIEQLGDVEVDELKNTVRIKFYGDMEHQGFIEFCNKITKEYGTNQTDN